MWRHGRRSAIAALESVDGRGELSRQGFRFDIVVPENDIQIRRRQFNEFYEQVLDFNVVVRLPHAQLRGLLERPSAFGVEFREQRTQINIHSFAWPLRVAVGEGM